MNRDIVKAISELIEARIALFSMGSGDELEEAVLAAELNLSDLLEEALHE